MRSIQQDGKILTFFSEGDIVGRIDYSDKSNHYITDAVNNWMYGMMSIETVEQHSIGHAVKDGRTYLTEDMSFSSMRDKKL